jgi:hypothetical protein
MTYVPAPPAAPSEPGFAQPLPIQSQPIPLFDQPVAPQPQPIPSYAQQMPMEFPMTGAGPADSGQSPWMTAAPAPGTSPDQALRHTAESFTSRTGAARPGISRRLFSIVGLGTSAAAGLGLGYLLYKLFLSPMNAPKTIDGDENERKEEPPTKDAKSGNP